MKKLHKKCISSVVLVLLFNYSPLSFGQPKDPSFQMYRWNEDYQYLAEKTSLNNYEQWKHIPYEWNGASGHISFGGSLRSRLQVFENDRFGLRGGEDGSLWLNRFYGHVDVTLGDDIRGFIEIGSSHSTDSGDLSPGPFDEDTTYFSQAFVDWALSEHNRLRIGRQEMSLGSGRLMAARNGPNVRRSYDGIRLDSRLDTADLRLFYLQEVDVEDGSFNNTSHSDNAVWGLNSTWSVGKGRSDFYYVGLRRDNSTFAHGVADERRHSLGARFFGKQSAWDWNVEGVYQFGDFGNADISAWTLASILGYRFEQAKGRPRLALSVDIASGDKDPTDNRLETFNPLFPNLAYFEEAAIYSPQNFYNIEPQISWQLSPQLSITFDWDFFWRLEETDAVYVRGLRPLPGTQGVDGQFVAHTPSVSVDYQMNRHLKIDLSYSHFFAGEVIDNAGGDDIDFLKVQFEWKF